MDLDSLVHVLTPATVVSVALAGVFLGWFAWSISPRVRGMFWLANWIAGMSFFLVLATGRFVDGSDRWATWLGAGVLWTEYIAIGWLAILGTRVVYRRWLRGRAL